MNIIVCIGVLSIICILSGLKIKDDDLESFARTVFRGALNIFFMFVLVYLFGIILHFSLNIITIFFVSMECALIITNIVTLKIKNIKKICEYVVILIMISILAYAIVHYEQPYLYVHSDSDMLPMMQAVQIKQENSLWVMSNVFTGSDNGGSQSYTSILSNGIAVISKLFNIPIYDVFFTVVPVFSLIMFLMSVIIIGEWLFGKEEVKHILAFVILAIVALIMGCMGHNLNESFSASIFMTPSSVWVISMIIISLLHIWISEKKWFMSFISVFTVLGNILSNEININAKFCDAMEMYLSHMKLLYSGYIKSPWFVLLGCSLVVIYITEKKYEVRKYLIYEPLILLVVVISPIGYYLWYLLNANAGLDCSYYFLWWIPIYIIISYACTKLILLKKQYWEKLLVYIITIFIMIFFGSSPYHNKIEQDKVMDYKHEYNEAVEIIKTMEAFNPGGEKKIIAPENLTRVLRLADGSCKLFYYGENKYPQDEDKEVCVSINKEPPYLLPISNSAHSKSYGYVILESGQVDKDTVLNENKLFYLCETKDYEVYVVVY